MDNTNQPPQHPGVTPTPEQTPQQPEVTLPPSPTAPQQPAQSQEATTGSVQSNGLNSVPNVSLPGQTSQANPEQIKPAEVTQVPTGAPSQNPAATQPQASQEPKVDHKTEMLVFGLAVIGLLTSIFIVGLLFSVPALILGILQLKKHRKSVLSKVTIGVSVLALVLSFASFMLVNDLDVPTPSDGMIQQLQTTDEYRAAAEKVELVPFSEENAQDKKSIVFNVPKEWEQRDPITTTTTGIYRYLDLLRAENSEAALLKNGVMYAYNMAGIKEAVDSDEQELYAQNLLENKDDPNTVKNIESLGELKNVRVRTVERFDAAGLVGVELLFEAKLAIDNSPIYGKFITTKTAQNIQIMFLFVSSGQETWIEAIPLFDRIEESISFYN